MLKQRASRRAVLAGLGGFVGLLLGDGGGNAGSERTAVDQFFCWLPSDHSVGLLAAVPPAEAAPADQSPIGQWSSTTAWPLKWVHTHLLAPSDEPRTGKFLAWSSFMDGTTADAWDPVTGVFANMPSPDYNIFCSGHTIMADGQLFLAGGHMDGAGGDANGYPHAKIFNPNVGWTPVPDMNAGRWYPTATTLPTGEVLVIGGTEEDGSTWNLLPQVWQPASQSWRNCTNAQGQLAWYSHMYVAPNGLVFYAAPSPYTWYYDPSGGGAWSYVATANYGDRGWSGHSSAMYEDGKILLAGGGDVDLPPTTAAEVINLNDPSPAWRYVASMASPRRQHNMTVLPDGKVLVTGGSSGAGQDDASSPVYSAELWDPATEQWTTMDSTTTYRGYHSVAVLLPDARVLSAGGEYGGATAELYSPPYLFNGSRPTISSAPTKVSYGQAFSVSTPNAGSITQVNWISLPSVTHGRNQNQRLNHLRFTRGTGRVTVTAPSSRSQTPPGPYMLFILNGAGVPSVGTIVFIG